MVHAHLFISGIDMLAPIAINYFIPNVILGLTPAIAARGKGIKFCNSAPA